MKDLIEALTIFAKYQKETKYPTSCNHDVMFVVGVGKDDPSEEDKQRLKELGFTWSHDADAWSSFRFGSA